MEKMITFLPPQTNLTVEYWTVIDVAPHGSRRMQAPNRYEATQAAIRENGRVEKVVTTTTTSVATYDIDVPARTQVMS
jgi:hypothetical protein